MFVKGYGRGARSCSLAYSQEDQFQSGNRFLEDRWRVSPAEGDRASNPFAALVSINGSPDISCWLLLKSLDPVRRFGSVFHAASSLVPAAALFSGMPVGRPGHVECSELQPADPYVSLYLQHHGEGYSLRSEDSARLDSGAAD